MKPLLIYIAGPYTASDRQGIDRNVNRAIDVGIEIFNKGHFPYVPHLTDLVDKRAKRTGEGSVLGRFHGLGCALAEGMRRPNLRRGVQRRKHRAGRGQAVGEDHILFV